jgi:uncharacterized protein YbbK (DUF523 family)
MDKPRVGVSRCLLGDTVRYDGTHRLDQTVIGLLGPHVEWVPVCPEVEVGMGTPREPIHLVSSADGVPSMDLRVRLLAVQTGADWTERMHTWAQRRARELAALDLSGYVLKARSPSCGVDDVEVHAAEGEGRGRGLFAEALIDAMPDLPVIDEARLADPGLREAFLDRVRSRHARRRSG